MRVTQVLAVALLLLFFIPESKMWRRRRRRRAPRPRPARNCQVSSWSGYSACSHHCGNAGTQSRTRTKTVAEQFGGTCPYHFSESRPCNRNACKNGGQPMSGYCRCKAGYAGTCCERDSYECTTQPRPCQHICINTYGSYTCRCNACYTKFGTRCDLRQCAIGGRCYAYGTINPTNPCQNCNSANKGAWTNNNALRCSDGKACTRADRCLNGRCVGTPFTCLPCEQCHSDTCRVKPGYCTITVNGKKTCFSNNALRPGYPCQQCNSNSPHQWTNNNNLPCSDGNVKTKDDRCSNGACRGTPYTCLPCERHDGRGCPLNAGYCIVQQSGQRTCFANQQLKPGNPCQWCNPAASTSTWSNRNGISCNDGNKCTRGDTCNNGQCTSTPFTCNSVCQICNGQSCSQKPGFGFVNAKCTCKIAGKDYNHQVINPANQCQWCDLHDAVTKATGSWTNRPSVPCNDNNACTKKDLCSSGSCVGQAYSCQSSYPSSSCIKTSVCVGDGTCRDIFRPANTICRAAVDSCDKPEKCNGRLGACPAAVTDPITLRTGTVEFKDSTFTTAAVFQYATGSLYLGVSGFTISCGQMKYKWYLLDSGASCTTTTSTKGLLPNTNTKQSITGLNLKNNKSYKIAIQAVDMRQAMRPLICSSSITIDTTRPQTGWVRDGTAADVSFHATKLVAANWGGFTTRHGVGKYEWKVLYTPFRSSSTSVLLPMTSVGLNTRATTTFNNIVDGSTIAVQIRAYTKAGLYTERTSNGVIVDITKPTTGTVYDGTQTRVDVKYAKWTNSFSANWDTFNDVHSGMLYYQWAVKRSGASLITAYKNTALVRSGTFTGLNLVSGHTYCAIVKGYNKARLYSESSSNCVLIDHDAPRAGTVNDGPTRDIQHQSDGSTITANWNGFTDGSKGSGIVGYQYKITNVKNSQIIGWTSVVNRTTVRHSGLALKNGEKYFVTVRAVDAAGWNTDVKSNGVIVDTTRPVFTGTVKVTGANGLINGTTCVYVASKTTLQVAWPGFTDGHSGLDHYRWAVLPASQPPKTSEFTRISGSGLPTSASFAGLSLTEGKAYRVIIRAYNRAFLYTDAFSVLVIPDPSPPQPGIVSDGPNLNIEIDYQTSLGFVKATWTAFPEPHTRVKQYFYAVGSCTQGNYHVTGNRFIPVTPPTSTSILLRSITLVNGQRYCTKVKATNMAGVYSKEVSSDGFIADVTPPIVRKARVIDGLTGTDIDYQSNLAEMSASWEGINDPESAINHYEYGISRNRAGVPNILQFRNAGINTTARATGLSLSEDVYYFIVCAVNNAGLRKCLSSDGVLIDHTPPRQGVVHDGILEPDLRYQSSLTSMAANWEGIWDLESGIEKFEWAVKENTTNKRIVVYYTDVGLATHVKSEKPLHLVNGHTYLVHLRITSHAGAVNEIVSNGVTVDNTAPQPSKIYPGAPSSNEWTYKPAEKIFYTSRTSHISAYWSPFSESESEVWFYKWAIGTSKCGTQVQPLINIGRLTNANTTMSAISLKYGTKYYVTVTSRNRANLVSRGCSDAFVVDITAPTLGEVNIGHVDKHQRFVKSDSVTVNWKNFNDLESDIDYCEVFIGNMTKSGMITTVQNASSGKVTVSKSTFNPSQEYRAIVKCYNKVGLSSFALSSPFMIDNSPPVSHGPVLVGVSRDQSMQYQSNTNSITVTWPPFTDPESPIVEYWVAIGTTPLADNIVNLQSVQLATQFVKYNLQLYHSKSYYVTVVAVNAAGLNRSVSALPVLVDKTLPQAANDSVKDGSSGEDWQFVSMNETIAAHWGSIADPESGIITSRYCLGTKPYGCQIKAPTNVGTSLSFSCRPCKVNPGEKVYVTVEVINRAGLSVVRTSNGMLMDATPPLMNNVIDGNDVTGDDLDTALLHWNISVTWGGAEDKESGIQGCRWRIVDKNNQQIYTLNLTGPFRLGEKKIFMANQTYNALSFNRNRLYFNVISCRNRARQEAVSRSNGFHVVTKWPVPATVRDGPTSGIDLDYTRSTKRVDANWDKFQADLRDPVVNYAWAIGTTAGQEDVLKFKSVGLVTKTETILASGEPDLDVLNAGQKYYVTVKATSASGLSTTGSSDGFIVDSTPPVQSEVRVSFRVIDQAKQDVELNVNWDGILDKESGILDSKYCVGTTPGSCKSAALSSENATSATVPSFHPVSLAAYYVIVVVQNRAQLQTVMTSKKFSIDTSPPSQGQVIDGHGRDVDFINSTSVMTSQWGGFEDRDTGIKNCSWSLVQQSVSSDRSFFGNDSIVFEQEAKRFDRVTRGGLSLNPGSRYINRVTCVNKDGFTVTSVSNGVIVDVTPPVAGKVSDGDNFTEEISFIPAKASVKTVWRSFNDPESDIMGYRWALGTSPGKDDVIVFRGVGKETKGSAKNITLLPGSHYYVTVEAINGAGMTSEGWSNGFIVDDSPPELVQLSRIGGQWIGPSGRLSATWLSRDSQSGVTKTEYCVGTTPIGCQVRPMRQLPQNATSVTCLDCQLSQFVTYYVTVRVWNAAGLYTVGTTEGVKVDLTPPVRGRVVPNDDVIACTSNCTLTSVLSGFMDYESGIRSCRFAVRKTTGYITPFIENQASNIARATGLTLVPGQRYYTVVSCDDNAGLSTTVVSTEGVLVDVTRPTKGSVIISPDRTHDVYGVHSSCHLYNSTLRIHWNRFYDKESGITGFRVAVGNQPNATNILPFQDVGITTSFKLSLNSNQLNVYSGDIVYVTVEARNAAGLVMKAVSPPTRLVSADKEAYTQEGDFYCLNF